MHLHKNKTVVLLLISLLILLNTQLLYLLRPLWLSLYLFLKVVLLPFFISIIIAYLLHPVIHFLVRAGFKWGWAVGLIYGLFFIGVGAGAYLMIPELLKQGRELNEKLPQIFATLEEWLKMFQDHQEHLPDGIRKGISAGFERVQMRLTNWIGEAIQGMGGMMNHLMNLTLVPFLVYYILKDYDDFLDKVIRFLPRTIRKTVFVTMRNINDGIADYVSGQLIVSFLLGMLAYIGYLIIGFPYPLLFGFIAMIFNLVPYLGPFLGAIPAMLIAVTLSWRLTLWVAVVNIIAQTVENNFLSPIVTGKTTQIHPLLIILALLVGGEIGGVVGMILAVPFLVIVKEVVIQLSRSMVRPSSPPREEA